MTALVILDLLEDFFDASLWPESIIPGARARLLERTNNLTQLCRAAGIPVIWFRQEFRPDLEDAFPHMRRSGKRYTLAGTKGCQLLSGLLVDAKDEVRLKTRFSAFFRTGLDETFERLGVKKVILAGITTAWCIRSTAVDAYQRDLEVIVAAECVAAFTANDHAHSVKAMEGYIAAFRSNAEIADDLLRTG